MIETVIFTVGCAIGLILGLFIGSSRGFQNGERSGFERGLRAKNQAAEASLFEYRSKFDRYQCSRKFIVRSFWDIESLEMAATSQVYMMGESLLDKLIANRVIKPYIVSRQSQGEAEEWTVAMSLYCAEDPVNMQFDSLPFIHKLQSK